MTIEVKPISVFNINNFYQTLDEVARERKYLLTLEAPPLKQVEEFVNYNIKNNLPQYVAIDSGKVIGWCDISPHTWTGLTHTGELGMGLLKDYRNKGIGYRLLDATIKKAFQIGLIRIELEVFSSNISAIRLYEKFGFNHEGKKMRVRFVDEVWDDSVIMALFND